MRSPSKWPSARRSSNRGYRRELEPTLESAASDQRAAGRRLPRRSTSAVLGAANSPSFPRRRTGRGQVPSSPRRRGPVSLHDAGLPPSLTLRPRHLDVFLRGGHGFLFLVAEKLADRP